MLENVDGEGGCLKGRRGPRKDEKASKNFSTGMGIRWEQKRKFWRKKLDGKGGYFEKWRKKCGRWKGRRVKTEGGKR